VEGALLLELSQLRIDLFFVQPEHLLVLLLLELIVHGLEGHLVVESVDLLSDLHLRQPHEVGSARPHG
jgi:hypothetical protein